MTPDKGINLYHAMPQVALDWGTKKYIGEFVEETPWLRESEIRNWPHFKKEVIDFKHRDIYFGEDLFRVKLPQGKGEYLG